MATKRWDHPNGQKENMHKKGTTKIFTLPSLGRASCSGRTRPRHARLKEIPLYVDWFSGVYVCFFPPSTFLFYVPCWWQLVGMWCPGRCYPADRKRFWEIEATTRVLVPEASQKQRTTQRLANKRKTSLEPLLAPVLRCILVRGCYCCCCSVVFQRVFTARPFSWKSVWSEGRVLL